MQDYLYGQNMQLGLKNYACIKDSVIKPSYREKGITFFQALKLL